VRGTGKAEFTGDEKRHPRINKMVRGFFIVAWHKNYCFLDTEISVNSIARYIGTE
jgi:hypothetical protein